jgi:hypothetical protein
MPISTNKNTAYGPPLVTAKYSPLENIKFDAADRPIYTGLLNNRMTMLRAVGLIGQQLELTVPNWNATVNAELEHLPPLVVVSSNRADWIRRGINAGNTQLHDLGIAAYNSASDLRALTDLNNGLGISPPLYAPSRIGANRNVYMVVNIAEYTFYKAQLANTGITPVGWNFAKGVSAQRSLQMVGFGATRFAAIEFCKTLRQQLIAQGGAAPWDSAWMLDDNTVALTNFAGFVAVEGALGANACAGLRGGTVALPSAHNKVWARAQLLAGYGQQVLNLAASVPPGILQQTALWNIGYLDTNRLNFGPLFITSAEDLSISKYFDNANIPYQFYEGIGVVKEIPVNDNSVGAAKLNNGRQSLTKWITTAESATPPGGAAPPPIEVEPADPADGGVQTLSDFITDRVLPNAGDVIRPQAKDPNMQAQAKSQAVEQLTSGALDAGLVLAGAIAATFRINGGNQQVVQMRDRP